MRSGFQPKPDASSVGNGLGDALDHKTEGCAFPGIAGCRATHRQNLRKEGIYGMYNSPVPWSRFRETLLKTLERARTDIFERTTELRTQLGTLRTQQGW